MLRLPRNPSPPLAPGCARVVRRGRPGSPSRRVPACRASARRDTPYGRSASTIALTTAGVEAIVPASPTPLTPSGLVVAGVSVRSVVKVGRSAADGHQVVGHRGGHQVAVGVVDRLLVQRLRDALGEAAVHLTFDDQRVHDLADVVDRHVRAELHEPGLGVHLGGAQVRAVREGEVVGVVGGLRVERRLEPSGRSCAANTASETSWIVRDWSGTPRTVNAPPLNSMSPSSTSSMVRGHLPGLVDHLVAGVVERHAADGQGPGAVGVHALGRDARVAVQDADVLERHTEPVGGDLRPRGLVTLPVGGRAGDDLDLAGGQHPHGRDSQPPAPYDSEPSTRDGASPHISVNVEMPMPSCTGRRGPAGRPARPAARRSSNSPHGLLGGRLVVARVVHQPGDRGVGNSSCWIQFRAAAPAGRSPVGGELVHHPLDGVGRLGSAGAAVGVGRGVVGEHAGAA